MTDETHQLRELSKADIELRDKRSDLLDIRGLLSPADRLEPPYPACLPLGDRVAPAIEMLLTDYERQQVEVETLRAEVARLEAEAGEACPAEIIAKADLEQARAELAALKLDRHVAAGLRGFAEYDANRLRKHRDAALVERDAMRPVVEAADRYITADADLDEEDVDSGNWKAAEQERDHAWDGLLDAHNAYLQARARSVDQMATPSPEASDG